jgi:uncharacterized protein
MPATKRSFFERRNVTILAVIAFCLPFIGLFSLYALRSNRNDVKSWLPEAYEETQTFKWYWQHFEGEAFILASWDGCTLGSEKLANIANALRKQNEAAEGEGKLRMFRDVTTGDELVNRLVDEQGLSREVAIERLRGSVIGTDGQQTCLLMTISPKEIGAWDQRNASGRHAESAVFHAAVEHIYETAGVFGIGRDEIHLGGPPVDNVSIDIEGERSMMTLAAVCAVLGLVMSYWTLRSWQFTVIVFTTSLFSAGLSLAIVWMTGTPMNAILMTMPALVFVNGASGAIHLSNYYRDAAAGGQIAGAADRALAHAWIPLALAAGTTAIGLGSLAVSELVPIQLFGIFSAVGIAGSFVVMCVYTPSIMEFWRPKRRQAALTADGVESTLWTVYGRPIADWIIRHHTLVTATCIASMVLGIYGCTRVETSVKLMRLFSSHARILEDYGWLEKRLGALAPVEVILRVDQDKCALPLVEQMRMTEEVRYQIEQQMPEVGSALAATTFSRPIPPHAGPLERRAWGSMLKKKSNLLRDYWAQDGHEQLWRISARVSALDQKLDYGEFVNRLKQRVDPILQFYRDHGVQGVTAVYTGVIPLVDKAQHSMFDNLLTGFTGDLILICIAIIVLMWNWSSGPLLMLPSLFPLLFVFGGMGLMGIIVDTGTVMAPAVALGVTVDDAIHFMLWCRRGQLQGMNRHDAIMFAYGDCAQAIYQSWAVIGLGLSAFALSAFMPTRRFGILMFTMLTISSVGNLVFLPALLAGPAGHWFWRLPKRLRKEHPTDSHPPVDDSPRPKINTNKHPVAISIVRIGQNR